MAMTLRKAAQQALEALTIPPEGRDLNQQALACYRAESILRAALAEPVQEPVAGCPYCKGTGSRDSGGSTPWGEAIFVPCDCHATPPQRQPLTDEQIASIVREAARGSAINRAGGTSLRIARAIERAHGIGGEA